MIEKTGGGSGNIDVVRVNEMEAEDVMETIEEMFGLGATDAPEDQATISELSQNRLVIRGNPGEVSEIVQMIQRIDVPFQREPGARTAERRIPMSSAEVDRTMSMLHDMGPSLRLSNPIEVVMPGEETWKFNRANRAFEVHRGDEIIRDAEQRKQEMYGTGDESENNGEPSPPSESDTSTDGKTNVVPKREDVKKDTSLFQPSRVYQLKGRGETQVARAPARNVFQTVSVRQEAATQEEQTLQEEQNPEEKHQNGSGLSSTEQEEIESEPGAPITLYVSDRGITIYTKDLDAGDMLEDLIMEELNRTSTDENMKLFLLRHREAVEAKTQLEQYLGLSSGGGGGGMGDMMSGFMRNALPGGAGDMASALLGGGAGGSSSSAIRELAGDVAIVADAKQYSLLVSALAEDMQLIEQLIDLIDQPTAIQNPNPNGQTQLIKINYLDPETLEGMVRANLATVLRNSEEAGGQQRGNAEARMQQQFLRSILGRNGGGGGGGAEQESPKAALSVDTRNNMLVVTGPQFIYDQIYDFVQLVDRRIERAPQTNDMVAVGDIDINLLAEILQAQDPNIQLIVDEEGTSTSPTSASNRTTGGRTSGATTGGRTNPVMSEDMMNAIRQGMRSQRRGGGGDRGIRGGGQGGNRGGGGGRRGGGR